MTDFLQNLETFLVAVAELLEFDTLDELMNFIMEMRISNT